LVKQAQFVKQVKLVIVQAIKLELELAIMLVVVLVMQASN